MYQPIDPNIARQGDIFGHFYFTFFQKDKLHKLMPDNSRGPIEYNSIAQTADFEVASLCKMIPAIIISQTCDIQRRDYVQLCPVFTVASYKEALIAEGKADNEVHNKVEELKNNKNNYYFHLDAYVSDTVVLEESYVDLQVVNSIQRSLITKFPRILGLTDKGIHWLSFKIMSYYGRPFS